MSEHIDGRETVVGLFELITSKSCPDWFIEQEVAVYLRLVNKDGKPITAGIGKSASHELEDNPLPRKYLGDPPRVYRADVIRWTDEETKHNPLKLTRWFLRRCVYRTQSLMSGAQKYGREGI